MAGRWLSTVLVAVAVPTLGLAGCREDVTAPSGPSLAIVDAAHGGRPGFFWLPPLLTAPQATGAFDPGASPTVTVCALTAQGCGAAVASFTTDAVPGGEAITVSAEEEAYAVNWKTGDFGLSDAVNYRITVSVGPVALGHLDVDVARNASQFRNLNTNQVIGLVDGRTLPIRFRIEAGAVPALVITPAPERVVVGQEVRFSATLEGTQVPVGQGLEWSSSDPQLMDIDILTGIAVANQPGTVTITARLGVIEGSVIMKIVPTGLLTFTSGGDIWTMTSTGGSMTRLTSGADRDYSPVWSPDGARIAFTRDFADASAQSDVYVMNYDGTMLTRVTSNYGDDEYPLWSPDGKEIVFHHQSMDEEVPVPDPLAAGLHVIKADGTGQRLAARAGGLPTWIDVTQIGHLGQPFASEIHLARSAADGSGTVDISGLAPADDTGDWAPQWSASAGKLAFSRRLPLGGEHIVTMNADGTGTATLTSGSEYDQSPNWSPDGRRIAFFRGLSPTNRIWVVNADGTGLTQLTSGPASDGEPVAFVGGADGLDWSRGGEALVFTRRHVSGRADVYVMNSNGTGQTNLTGALAESASQPDWQP